MNQLLLDLPNKEGEEVREKITKIIKWLEKNTKHEKYKKGVGIVQGLVETNKLEDWFNAQDFDFEISMEIINYVDIVEEAKKIFNEYL